MIPNRARIWAPWIVFASTLVMRLSTAARFPTEWDSVQYVLGVDRFDVTQDSPNAPGYWSYVRLARLVRAITPLDTHAALVLLAAVASAATGAFLFLAARRLGGDWLGWAAAVFWATSPVAWFYGSIVDTKVFDALALSGLIALAVHARRGGRQALWAGIAVGVASGFRPSSVLVLGPLFVYLLVRCCRRPVDAVAPIAAAVAGAAAWLVPASLEQPGGLATLRAVNDFMYRITATKTSLLYGAPLAAARDNAGRALVTALVIVAPVLPVFLLGVAGRLRETPGPRWPPGLGVLALATLPGLALTVGLNIGTAGHALSYAPAAMLFLLAPAAVLHPRLRVAATVAVVACGALGAQRFLAGNGSVPARVWSHRWIPVGTSRAEIRRVDAVTRRDLALGSALDPARDVLVFLDGNGLARFRPLSLFLDRYASHLVIGHGDGISTYRRHEWFDEDAQIEVPPGGRAVVVLDGDDPGVGGASLPLPGGLVARAVAPGGAVAGVPVVADPNALRPKTDAAHRRPCGGSPC